MKSDSLAHVVFFCGLVAGSCIADDSDEAAQAPAGGVAYKQIVDAADRPNNWLTYSGQYSGQRYSRLKQISSENVDQLKVKWVRQFPISEVFECSPVVVDGVMFVTLPENKLVALDARTGLQYWEYSYDLPQQLAVCCGKINRGVATLHETLYMGTLDAHLVAIDSKSGNEIWRSGVAEASSGT